MSYVLIMTSDKALPVCDRAMVRDRMIAVEGDGFVVSASCGFCVTEHRYYRKCTDALGYPFRPWQYELDLYKDKTDLHYLKDYLSEHLLPGNRVDLWHVCVSDKEERTCPPCVCKTLEELDLDTLALLLEHREYGEESWLSITI